MRTNGQRAVMRYDWDSNNRSAGVRYTTGTAIQTRPTCSEYATSWQQRESGVLVGWMRMLTTAGHRSCRLLLLLLQWLVTSSHHGGHLLVAVRGRHETILDDQCRRTTSLHTVNVTTKHTLRQHPLAQWAWSDSYTKCFIVT